MAWMYATYAAHGALDVSALVRGGPSIPLPRRTSAVLGGGVAVGGAALTVAGVGRFDDAGQVSGTRTGSFVTRGVYRWTRNPQYAGYVLVLAGAALARRSVPGLALAGAAAAVFASWVPVEERHLRRALGDEYLAYKAGTPRWLGRPRRHR